MKAVYENKFLHRDFSAESKYNGLRLSGLRLELSATKDSKSDSIKVKVCRNQEAAYGTRYNSTGLSESATNLPIDKIDLEFDLKPNEAKDFANFLLTAARFSK